MANLIKLRRSAVTGAVPTTAQLELGELAINTHDGKLFLKRNNGTESIVQVGSSLITDNGTRVTVNAPTTITAPNTSAAAWLTSGINLVVSPATFTDTSSSGTIGDVYINRFGAQTMAATSATTVTRLFGAYFTNPVGGTNVTASNPYALGADSLRVEGAVFVAASGAESVQLGSGTTTGQTILGGTSQTGNMTLGQSTVSQITNIQAGATASGSTKTINIGTGGLSGSTTAITIGSATSGATQTTRINGNVGIGNAPAVNLEVSSATGSAAPTPTEVRISTTTIASDFSQVLPWGRLSFYSADTSDTGPKVQGSIDAISDSAAGGRMSMVFSTSVVTSGVLTERMRLSANGNVSIITNQTTGIWTAGGTSGTGTITLGQSTDSQTTNIQAGATASGSTKTINIGTGGLAGSTTAINIGSTASSTTVGLNGPVTVAGSIAVTGGGNMFSNSTASTWGIAGGNAFNNGGSITFGGSTSSVIAGGIYFSTGTGATNTERMRIDGSGNVGIGETSPGAKLHVFGGTVGTTAGNLLNVTIDQGLAGGNAVGIRTNLVRVSSGTDWTTTAMRLQGRVDATNFGYIDLVSGGAQGIAFGSDASERMRIDSSGNVGIGTSSPGFKLQVNGFVGVTDGTSTVRLANSGGVGLVSTVTNHPLAFQTNDAERMRIDTSGNVGIGTSSPDANAKLDVAGTVRSGAGGSDPGTGAVFYFVGSGSFQTVIGGAAFAVNTGANNARTERMRIASDGTTTLNVGGVSSTHQFNYNESGGEIQLIDSTGAGPILLDNISGLARLYKVGTGAMSIGTTGANYLQYVTNNTERMRITSAGNVGIGTSSPGKTLDLVGQFRVSGSAASGYALLEYGTSATATNNWHVGSEGDGTFRWYNGNFGAGTERMRIASDGNVGIGTSSPGASTRLNVNGRGLFTGGSYDPGDSTASGVSISYDTGSNIGIIGAIQTGVTEREMRMRGNTLTFFTNGANERMRVTETGNIGIGTTAAAQRLHVRQDQDGTTAAIIQNRNATGSPASALQFISGAFDLSDNRYAMISSAGGSNTTLQFWTAAGASPTQKMVITSAGNVGIGVASPPQLLALGNTTDQVGAGVSGAVSTLYFGSPSNGSGGIKRLAYDRASGALTFIGGGVVNPSTQMTIASGGEITAAVDFRAPIFYDSNDTGKYLNPNGSSFLIGTTVITRDSNSNDVFGGLELRENNVQGAATGAANEAPGINFHWSMRGAARIYMNGAGNFVFAGQSDITNNRRDIIFASGYAATRVDAPIFRDSDNTAFFFDGASTTNINTLNGNGKQIFNTGDSYLRINETSAFTNGCWFGGSLLQGGGFYTGSNGGTTNSRVAIIGGTFNGTNVITLDGSNGRITASDIRAPIFYDTDNTGFYVNPAGDTNLNKTFTYLGGKDVNANWNTGFQNTPTQSYNFHGDVSSGGPAGAWWFYESMRHSNGANYWGTQIAWGWEDNANRLFQRNITSNTFSGWVEYLNTSNRTYNGNLNMTGSIISTSSDVRAPVFYDQNDTGYYVDPNASLSAVFVGDITMGPELNMVVGTRGDRYIDVKGDLYFRYSDNATFYNSRMLIRQSGAILSYADFESSGNITAYASDRRLKTNIVPIKNALQKLLSIGGYTFDWDMDKCEQHGFTPTQVHEHGVIAQEIEEIMPDVVVHAPFDKETRPNHDMSASRSGEWFKTVNYDKIVPLLIEAIKEQQAHINKMQQEIEILKGDK